MPLQQGKSQKVINLRRDPKISALVESGDTYSELRGVEVTGTGRIVDDPAEVVAHAAEGLPAGDARSAGYPVG